MATTGTSRYRGVLRRAGRAPAISDDELQYGADDLFGHETPQRKEFFRRVFHYLRFNEIEGDYAEFGCHSAVTFRLAWNASRLVGRPTRSWAFDSFAGLPASDDPRDAHPRWQSRWLATSVEEFRAICDGAGIPADAYVTVAGLYDETLRQGAEGPRPGTIGFAYVDCDLYSSACDVLAFLEDRLRPGSVVGFDDFYCYGQDAPSGERLAAAEHFAAGSSRWQLVPFVQYGWHGMSFVIERRGAVAGGVWS